MFLLFIDMVDLEELVQVLKDLPTISLKSTCMFPFGIGQTTCEASEQIDRGLNKDGSA